MNRRMVLLLVVLLFCAAASKAQTLLPAQWVANGPITAMAAAGDTVYLAGRFEYIGPLTTKNGTALSQTNGTPNPAFPSIGGPNATVNTAISDSQGGWYIGGEFTSVGSQSRNNLARINADGSVSAWNPGTDYAVRTLALYGGKVYAGGEFGIIGGRIFNFLAAVDTGTGLVDSLWDPEPDAVVTSLAVSAGYLYAGGDFLTLNNTDVPSSRIAKIDRVTGNADSTFPSVSATESVFALAIGGDTLYVGGNFSKVGTVTVANLASIDVSSDTVTSWAPGPNGAVRAILVHGSSIYAGGDFYQLGGGDYRIWCSEFSRDDGTLTPWAPGGFNDFSGSTWSLTFANGAVYVSGDIFANEPGVAHSAAFDSITGNLTNWYPASPMNFYYYDWNMYSVINTISASGSQIYAGGQFNSIGGKRRRLMAAVSASTGAVLDWRPGPFGGAPAVYSLAVQGSSVYIGGDFTQLKMENGTTYNKRNLAVVDRVTGTPNAWTTETNRAVRKVLVSGNTLYVAGDFDTIGTVRRYGLAAVDATNGNISSWAPSTADTLISDIAVSGSTVYIGGQFLTFGGVARSNLAAIDAGTGAMTSWAPNPDAPVYSLLVSGGNLYVGGSYGHIAGQVRNSLSSFATSGGTLNSWNPNVTSLFSGMDTPGWVYALNMQPSALFVGGVFYKVGGQPRRSLASVDPASAAVSPFSNTFGSWNNYCAINAFASASSPLVVGGEFDTVNSALRPDLMAFTTSPLPIQLASFTAGINDRHEAALSWTTSSETNNFGFYVQKKTQAETMWSEIAGSFIAGHGTTLQPHHYGFVDSSTTAGQWSYRLRQVDLDGTSHFSDPVSLQVLTGVSENRLPTVFQLSQNYPNPFNPTTRIRFSLPGGAGSTFPVTLKVYNILGQEVATLVNGQLKAGYYDVVFPAAGAASGVYFYRLNAGSFSDTKKMILTK